LFEGLPLKPGLLIQSAKRDRKKEIGAAFGFEAASETIENAYCG
jgi:hypothetical protein